MTLDVPSLLVTEYHTRKCRFTIVEFRIEVHECQLISTNLKLTRNLLIKCAVDTACGVKINPAQSSFMGSTSTFSITANRHAQALLQNTCHAPTSTAAKYMPRTHKHCCKIYAKFHTTTRTFRLTVTANKIYEISISSKSSQSYDNSIKTLNFFVFSPSCFGQYNQYKNVLHFQVADEITQLIKT